jgi:uncharacterized membrane protein HdeD (DUF308 family)
MKCYLTILFGLFVIWTGLLRCIEAQAFKPNAFWFCLTMGLVAIAAGFVFRIGKTKAATILALIAGVVVLGFYLNCLIKQPEKDATYRVGLAIVASFAQIAFVLLPDARTDR